MGKAIDKIMKYAVHVAEPEMILLFGSYAKGKENLHSDVDMLIISNRIFMKKQTEREIIQFARDCSIKADVLIHTKSELERASEQPLSFLYSILKEGKIIYKKTAND